MSEPNYTIPKQLEEQIAKGDLADRLQALAERNSEPVGTALSTQLEGEQLLMAFEELLAEGRTPDQAAADLGRTGSYMRKFRSPKSSSYDPEHEARFDEIMAPDGEHREALIQVARGALVEAAKDGNVRAIEKILMAYDPDFQFLRPAALGGVNVEQMFVQIAPRLPTEVLMQMRKALEKDEQAQQALEQKRPDIEQ